MKIGVFTYNTEYTIRIDELARAAEERGFESVWAPEHTHIPKQRKSPWPGGPELPKEYWQIQDPFVGLAAVAAVTTRIRLGTGICLAVEHLWQEISPPTLESSSWPVSEWHTRETCEQALTQKLASDSERDTEMDMTVDRQAGRPRLWVRRKGHSEPLALYSYFCLPDTGPARAEGEVKDPPGQRVVVVSRSWARRRKRGYGSGGRRSRQSSRRAPGGASSLPHGEPSPPSLC
jgi:hypothetical protein